MIPENEDILISILNTIKKVCEPITESQLDNYLTNYYFYPSGATAEGFDSEDGLTNVNLIHNIQYGIRGMDIDGDTPVLRIYTVKEGNNCRYFTSFGTDYELGFTTEHTRETFISLLDTHRHLVDNSVIKTLRTIMLHDELQENVQDSCLPSKRPKM